MAKYTSDTNLIKGAATAYRNYDNAAGMYSGLDKVTQAGMGMVDEAVKGYEAEQEKLEKEAKKAQAKADKLNDNWNTLASGVYESAGSFMKDVEYKDTVASVKALRQEYIDAQNSKDAEKMAEVKIKFNNINTEISAHKEFRAKLTHPEYGMSDFVTGDNREYMNGFINEDYVIGRNDKKEKTYTVNGVTKTMEQINKMVDVKNMKPYADYGKLVNDYSTSKTKGNKNNLLLSIRNGIVPDQENPLRAFLNDKGFGNGQTFSDLLKTDVNRASIEKVLLKIGGFDNEEDSKGVISKSEYDNFINAIVNPDNEFWKNNGGASAWKDQSRTIATELLANGAENAWDTNPANKPDPVVTDETKTDKNLGIADWTYPEFGRGKLDWKSARGIKRRILNGTTFKYDADADGVKETYDYIDGTWYENWEDKDNMGTKIGSADDLVFNVLETEHEAFQGLETTPVETATITEEGLPIQTATKEQINKSIFADIDVSNDRSAANALNKRFGLTERESDVMFSPYGTGPGKMQNDLGSSDIMMYDPQTGKLLRDPETKEVYSFKIGDEAFVKGSDLNPTVEKIIKILKEQYNIEYDPFEPQKE